MSYINNNNFAKAVNFIYDNIDKPMTLDDIATYAAISVSTLRPSVTVGATIRHLQKIEKYAVIFNNIKSFYNIFS